MKLYIFCQTDFSGLRSGRALSGVGPVFDHDLQDLLVGLAHSLAAQAADDLLAIQGVCASFVIFQSGREVNISARSLGDINVQVIMEKLGGGGHMTMAAAQLRDVSLSRAKSELIRVLDENLEQADARRKD